MLERDKHRKEYTSRFYSKVSQKSFYKDIETNLKLSEFLDITLDQELIQLEQKRNITLIGSFICSGVFNYVVFRHYKLLENKKILKFILASLIIVMPPIIAVDQFAEEKDQIFWRQYVDRFEKYIKFKQTGLYN
ncbi:hypothetical protein pb186bvf_012594 [Paramecium bursaria]